MKFKKGKKVRLTKVYYENIPEGTILTMDDICLDDSNFFLCYKYPELRICLNDCEEIETKPTLEEVKEYFKDAKEVRSLYAKKETYFKGKVTFTDNEHDYGYWDDNKTWIWDEDNGYAEIVTYKMEGMINANRQDKPQHYTTRTVNGLDVIDLVKHWNLNFNEGNILKYLIRDKGQDIQDLEKIIDYAQRELKHLTK